MKYFLYILMGLTAFACTRKPDYDDTPEISFNENKTKIFRDVFSNLSQSTLDSVIFAIDFKDGDGDLGLDEDDRLNSDNINFFMIEYKKQDGEWLQNLVYKEQFQLLSPEELSGPIDGTIFNVKPFNHADYNVNDTLKFRVTIKDRAGHTSNTLETPEFIIQQQ